MLDVKNKYIALVFLFIGAVIVQIFADGISDYLKNFRVNLEDSHNQSKSSLSSDSSINNPSLICFSRGSSPIKSTPASDAS